MIGKLAQWIRDVVTPFAEIARELRAIRELYETSLAERRVAKDSVPAPVYRITESPSTKDTEVTYAGVDTKRPKAQDVLEDWEKDHEDAVAAAEV